MRNLLIYYRRVFATAFRHSWSALDFVSTLLGILLPIAAKLHPEWRSAMSDLAWQIPLTALGTLVAARIILAPYWLHREREVEFANIEKGLSEKIESITSELTRPKFRIKNPKISEADEEGLDLDQTDFKHKFDYDLENVGARASSDLFVRIILIEESLKNAPKTVESSVAHEIAINESIGMTLMVGKLDYNEPPHYIIAGLRYEDAVTEKIYKQIIFMKWAGSKRGIVARDMIIPKTEERQKLLEHLKEQLSDFISDNNQLSQNVGSTPNS